MSFLCGCTHCNGFMSVFLVCVRLGPGWWLFNDGSVFVTLSLTNPLSKYLGLAPCASTPRSSSNIMSLVYLLHAGSVDIHNIRRLVCASAAWLHRSCLLCMLYCIWGKCSICSCGLILCVLSCIDTSTVFCRSNRLWSFLSLNFCVLSL